MNSQVPTNRKARIAAIRDPETSHQLIMEILESDFQLDVIRSVVLREDSPSEAIELILNWSQEAGSSRFGPTYENSSAKPVLGNGDPNDEYNEYQTRYGIFNSLINRKFLPMNLVERVANDPRISQAPAMLAANNLLTDDYISHCLRNRPDTREYFYVFPKNLTENIRRELIDLAISENQEDWIFSLSLHTDFTPEEQGLIDNQFKKPTSFENSEKNESDNEAIWREMHEKYDAIVNEFYSDKLVNFISGDRYIERITRWKLESSNLPGMSLDELIETFHEGLRGDFYRFSEVLSSNIQRAAAEDDFYYACFCLAHRPNLDLRAAQRLFEDSEPVMRFAVAQNLSYPHHLAVRALDDPNPTVRVGFAQRGEMYAQDLIRILEDPIPAVSQMVFNEKSLHLRSGWLNKFLGGKEEEFVKLVTEFPVDVSEWIIQSVIKSELPQAVPAINALANSREGFRRVALMRSSSVWSEFLNNSIDDFTIVKLAGDKLSQVRKYAVDRKVSRNIRQLDYLRLIMKGELSSFQKSILAAGLTDRREFSQVVALDDDQIRLGCYLNWKASESDLREIRFNDSTLLNKAKQLRMNRDMCDDFVETPKFTAGDFDPENPFARPPRPPWIGELSIDEQDAFWGGFFPRGFVEDGSD